MSGPVDHNGKPLQGAALARWRQAEAQRQAEAERRADVEAVASLLALVAARVTGLPAPDALRAVAARSGPGGADAALRVLRAAGQPAEAVAQSWQAQAPVQRQISSGPGLDADPAHDPAVVAMIMAGASPPEIHAKIAEITRERQAAAAARRSAAATGDHGGGSLMWRTRDGRPLQDGTAGEAHPQRSVIRQEWTDYPDHGRPQSAAPQL